MESSHNEHGGEHAVIKWQDRIDHRRAWDDREIVGRTLWPGGSAGHRVRPSGAENADETVRGLATDARYFGADLNRLADLETSVAQLADDVGGIDILVNNAAFVVNKPHEEFSIEEYEEEVRVNSTAAFVLARACSKHMKQKMYGKIINLTSLTLNGNWEGFVPYVASKGAMFGLVKSMARELGKYNITVNGISPGAVLSDAEWRHFGEKREAYHQWILERQSIKRRIEPVDIANLAVFLVLSAGGPYKRAGHSLRRWLVGRPATGGNAMGDGKPTLLADGFLFLEAPKWHDGRLWVSDVFDHKVHALTTDGKRCDCLEIPNRPSGLGILSDGSLVIVSAKDRKLLRYDGIGHYRTC